MWNRPSFRLACCTAVLLLGLPACGAGNSGDTNGPVRTQAYDNDGLLGATRANPNLPTSPTYHNYSNDMKLFRDTIAQIPGVEDSTVLLNGPTAYVTLMVPRDMDIEASMRVRNSAQASLQRMLPRYEVRVSVRKNGTVLPGRS